MGSVFYTDRKVSKYFRLLQLYGTQCTGRTFNQNMNYFWNESLVLQNFMYIIKRHKLRKATPSSVSQATWQLLCRLLCRTYPFQYQKGTLTLNCSCGKRNTSQEFYRILYLQQCSHQRLNRNMWQSPAFIASLVSCF